jgi:hypothetical protein
MKASVLRTCLAGVFGGFTLNIAMLLTFRLLGFGWQGGGILLDPSRQSQKLIAVWTQIDPIPLVVSKPAPIIIGLVLFGIGHAFVYRWLAPAWPEGIIRRAWRIGILIYFLSFFFWEFFTPFNLFGEPLPFIGLELIFWAVIAFAEAYVIALVFEWGVDSKTC